MLYKFISPMTPEVWEQDFLPRIARPGGAAHERAWAVCGWRLLPWRCGVLALAVLAACGARALALDAYGQLEDPALQARFEHITQDLRCLVCQNESIADSNVELASDLRRQVREMLVAGKTTMPSSNS